MYIKSIDIENIRSIKNFHWEFNNKYNELAGWHVLVGDNGSGKSTILKAISLALIGEAQAQVLYDYWSSWLPFHAKQGKITINAHWQSPYDGKLLPKINAVLRRHSIHFDQAESEDNDYSTYWFSAAYGPFRRFSGGTPTSGERAPFKRLAHLSIFGEEIALTDTLDWLRNLRFKELEDDPEADILAKIRHFVNQEGFLPHQIRLTDVSSNGVFFLDANGESVPVEQLGDGYRSILSMTLDIIRQMQFIYSTGNLFNQDNTQIMIPGVVLIDEVDAHLHPEWQRTIGNWLIKLFPRIQFIVTTHSPLVCQAALHGSIWRLPAPGSDEKAHQITPDSEDWKRLVYGDILEAYSTDLFGENINRSLEAQAMFEELGKLSAKEMEAPLSPEEEKRLNELENELPSTPYKDTVGGGYD
jgi:predicted ATP-dependent endonuclease of OLD family